MYIAPEDSRTRTRKMKTAYLSNGMPILYRKVKDKKMTIAAHVRNVWNAHALTFHKPSAVMNAHTA